MKKIVSVIITTIIMLNTSLATYTSTVKADGFGIVVTSEKGKKVEITPTVDEIYGWEVESGDTIVTNNQFIMPEENVVIKAMLRNTLTIEMPDFARTEDRKEGEIITIEATEEEEKEFVGWIATGITLTEEQATSNSITITMPGNAVTLKANYRTATYTVTYNENGGSGAPASQTKTHGEALTLSSIEPTKEGCVFKGWATSDTATTVEYEAGSEYTGNTNITLYAVWQQLPAVKDVALGAYITYVPDETEWTVSTDDSGYTSAQTFNPSNTKSWRVLNNNNGQLEIISTRSVGDLYLQGETGYAKAVYTLNKLCEGYKNETYAISARNPGYVKGNRTEETADTTVVEGSSQPIIDTAEDAYPLNYGVSGFPYTDTLYDTDQTQISTAGVFNSNEYVWFASRYLTTKSFSGYFSVRIMNSDGTMMGDDLYHVSSSNDLVDANSKAARFRPIVTLKSGIKITGGDGTSTNPYTIAID